MTWRDWTEEATIATNVSIERLDDINSPTPYQGYYPRTSEFIKSLRYYAEGVGIDPKDVIAEYKSSSLYEILTSKHYQRFPNAIRTYSTMDIRMIKERQTIITRAPLAYGFIVNPNRACSFMEDWYAYRDESVLSKDQATPVRAYRELRADNANSKFASRGERWHPKFQGLSKGYPQFARIAPDLVEAKLARVFGATDRELELISYRLPAGDEGLPITAYLSGLGLSEEGFKQAAYLAYNFFTNRQEPRYPLGKAPSLHDITPHFDLITSRDVYHRAVEIFGDDGGEVTLAWMILSEMTRTPIATMRTAMSITDKVSTVSDLMARGVELITACEMADSDIDPMILDVILDKGAA